MKNKLSFLVIVLIFLQLSFIFNVSAQSEKVDEYIKAEMQKRNIPGLSLAVVKEGKVIKMNGYGLANIETNVPVTTETVFKIGSLSKPIIAEGIMMLVEEGKISLDDKVSKYLENTPESWKDISVRNLLSHTSGIIREAPGFDPAKIQPDADVIKTAYSLPLRFTPGEKYEYCNVGYFSLAEIIHKVSGKSWGDFLTERIFKPLEMNATRTTTFSEIVPNRSNAYTLQNGKLQNSEVYLALRPSGAFLSTVSDLAKFEAALYSAKFLRSETRKLMWTPFKFNDGKDSVYGLGWRIDDINGRKQIHHGGSLNGFKSEFARFPDDKITVIILTNLNEAMPSEIAVGVAGFYIPALLKKVS
jgi:CubicO group peptidase (beta-lactamase class C family)